MMTINVADATPVQLDWLMAKCLGLKPLHHYTFAKGHHILPHPYYEDWDFGFTPTTDVAISWPLFELERIVTLPSAEHRGDECEAFIYNPSQHDLEFFDAASYRRRGSTRLIAGARCFVASRMGDVVEVPEELS